MRESQPAVAQKVGVETDTISNWELHRNEPQVRYIPKIIAYLGYTPLFDFAGMSPSKKLRQFMYVFGMTQKDLGKKFELDPATIKRVVEGGRVMKKTIHALESKLQY